jgi:hypothetical protein
MAHIIPTHDIPTKSEDLTSITFDVDSTLIQCPDYVSYGKGDSDSHRYIKKFIINYVSGKQIMDLKTSEYYVDTDLYPFDCFNNGFFSAIFRAWSKHEHLTLSPDNFWYQIINEVATHIERNSDAFKSLFTDSVEKVKISVDITGKTFDDGVDLIVEQLNHHVKDKEIVNLFTVPFTTTTPLIQTCYGAVLMNAMKNYFEYNMRCVCGIRKITLQGKKSDWIDLMSRIKKLREMPYAQGIETNLDAMADNLHKIISSYDNVDKTFWSQIISYKSGPCFSQVTGWITNFFIYDNKGSYIKSGIIDYIDRKCVYGKQISPSDIPLGFCTTPFSFDNNGDKSEMRLCCGQSGIQILPDKSISPSFFRAIVNVRNKDTKQMKAEDMLAMD